MISVHVCVQKPNGAQVREHECVPAPQPRVARLVVLEAASDQPHHGAGGEGRCRSMRVGLFAAHPAVGSGAHVLKGVLTWDCRLLAGVRVPGVDERAVVGGREEELDEKDGGAET
eukprot:CAMPEP_0172650292 /NCGR_PEP_ID=MMETSP1068-20121228/242221_1 /TAXON_ID=35684 /ORGANISM="Pseudopedinella elastica, Strain CCMP716" /LENGTH=114 /DNA_ID=CAMNT_0013464655 /DNA_START=619 /DNA_END=965 /DNA_ORIENTATION=-